jgi:hypothetical protein
MGTYHRGIAELSAAVQQDRPGGPTQRLLAEAGVAGELGAGVLAITCGMGH